MITVVIPYFQRSEGILRKALASVAAQLPAGLPVHVIVVDDESPVPAGPEVESTHSATFSVQIINQVNAGPGAARNNGLDHAPGGTRYIAFLDSDDEWSPDHLQRAVAALESGFDFYFADHLQLGASISAFQRSGHLKLEEHIGIPSGPSGLHCYAGDLVDQTIRGNLIGTSTVVFRLEQFRSKRFRVEFTNAGEDYLFWMELAQHGARVAFSSQCEAKYGRGVNVYAGSGWGTEQNLLRVHNEMKYRKLTKRLFALSSQQLNHIDGCVRDLRRDFARDLLYRVAHIKRPPWHVIRQHFKLDPLSFVALPSNVVKIVLFRNR